MEIELLLNHFLTQHQDYKRLYANLLQKEQKCLLKAENDNERENCRSKRKNFQQYLQQYTYQFKQKGRKMCYSAMRAQNDLEKKILLKDQCVNFYTKSFILAAQNINDKIKSLVQTTDYDQL